MFTINYEKEPPEVFYKKAVLGNFSKPVFESLFNQVAGSQICSFVKKKFQHSEYCEIFKYVILKEICEWLLLNNVK